MEVCRFLVPESTSPMPAIRCGILFVPEYDPEASQALRDLLREVPNLNVVQEKTVSSQRNWIEDVLVTWCDEDELDLVLTVGGTLPAAGPGADEIVPEVTAEVVDRLLPGIAETMRTEAIAETALASLDRGVSGIRSRSAVLNLPAGAGPACLFLDSVLDVLAPLFACLRGDAPMTILADGITPKAGQTRPVEDASDQAVSRLDPAEFEAFLQRGDRDQTDGP